MQEAAVPIFVVTYALLSLSRVRGREIPRPAAALIGAGLMVLFGVVTPFSAGEAVWGGIEILMLLTGMMLLVANLEVAGFFEFLAAKLDARAKSPRAFFIQVCVASGVLSALMLNDAVVLLLTPVVIKTARRLGASALPFLIGEAMFANIGSTATIVGNPQNAYIAIVSGVSFVNYAAVMVPVTAACMAVALWISLIFFRRQLPAERAQAPPRAADAPAPVTDGLMLRVGVGGLLGVTALFVLSSFIGISVAQVALGGGLSLLGATLVVRGRSAGRAVRRVDWTILALFCGLFIVLRGLEDSGALKGIVEGVSGGPGAVPNAPTLFWLAAVTSLISNGISNVPAVLLLSPAAAAFGSTKVWLVLAASSTMAGNATLLGAAANLITAQVARHHGEPVPWWPFTIVGLPVAAATVALSTLLLALAPL